jgi:hypothetical protein
MSAVMQGLNAMSRLDFIDLMFKEPSKILADKPPPKYKAQGDEVFIRVYSIETLPNFNGIGGLQYSN